jgi:flagellar biogenesis protein FliO
LGVFANALNLAVEQPQATSHAPQRSGLAAWVLNRFKRRSLQPRLALVERIILAPRQTVSLIEADGQRILVATSPEGASSFFPLPAKAKGTSRSRKIAAEGKHL